MQSIIVFGIINIILVAFGWIPWFGWVVSSLAGGLAIVFWVVLVYKAYKGEMYKLPVAGDLAEKWSSTPTKK